MMEILRVVGVNSARKKMVEVRCVCGFEFIVREDCVKLGRTTSCGCQKVVRMRELGLNSRKHGLSTIPEYRTWQGMIRRCVDPKHKKYAYYGGRGITVCDRWRTSFPLFLLDMGRRPDLSFTLDRINVNGNYEPGNCRWTTWHEQNKNRRRIKPYSMTSIAIATRKWRERKKALESQEAV